jgi:hypothetical protein
MRIGTGIEKTDGTFSLRVVGESRDCETPKEALQRIAERFLGCSLTEKKHEWRDKWGRVGPHDQPTEWLVGLFVGRRLFTVLTEWDQEKCEWIV